MRAAFLLPALAMVGCASSRPVYTQAVTPAPFAMPKGDYHETADQMAQEMNQRTQADQQADTQYQINMANQRAASAEDVANESLSEQIK